jgi:adenine-specific DNA-methyltransferase
VSVAVRPVDTPEQRKARGAFFTPSEVAEHITEWAIRSPSDRVLEPSCGEAEFLLSAGSRLRELGGRAASTPRLLGVELHEESARAATRALARAGHAADVRTGDFFDVEFEAPFDAVVGNPPYVRYQDFSGEARAKAQRAALKAGVRLSGLASSWAPFTVQSATFLGPDGRLGLVLPAELLTVNYAAPVRRFLMDRFARVRLVMFDERVFPGVLAEVVLLLAEGSGGTDSIEVSQVRNLAALHALPIARWSPSDSAAKWSQALLPSAAAEVYDDLLARSAMVELERWGATDLGMVTGNNRYFTLSAAEVEDLGLPESELLPISPPGSRHLRGLALSRRSWEVLRDEGRQVFLFRPEAAHSAAAAAYIKAGEEADVDAAYKCRIRQPWWRVPEVERPDLLFTYMNADTPRIVANEARVHYLNSIHGIHLNEDVRSLGRDLLPLGALNSLTLLGAELVGRSYGGGILKLEPKEADVLPVPAPELLASVGDELRALRPRLAQMLRRGDLLGAVEHVDRVLLVEGGCATRADLEQLRAARALLHDRRISRGSG